MRTGEEIRIQLKRILSEMSVVLFTCDAADSRKRSRSRGCEAREGRSGIVVSIAHHERGPPASGHERAVWGNRAPDPSPLGVRKLGRETALAGRGHIRDRLLPCGEVGHGGGLCRPRHCERSKCEESNDACNIGSGETTHGLFTPLMRTLQL